MDIPGVIIGQQKDYKEIYVYGSEGVLKVINITLQAGYGLIDAGFALSQNESAAGGVGKFLPYNPTTFTGGASENHPGRAYLVASNTATGSTVAVTIEDSYKFAVGDDLIINDNTTTKESLGAITAIDRTTYSNYAVITFTTATGGTAFTTARFAHVFVEAGDNTNNYSDCVGILEKSVDTGLGVNAKGAVATLIWGNCALWNGMVTNVDSAARTDISATVFGQQLMIR